MNLKKQKPKLPVPLLRSHDQQSHLEAPLCALEIHKRGPIFFKIQVNKLTKHTSNKFPNVVSMSSVLH